ncbi:hypothetical protein QLQ85_11360 [Halomonas sp. M4R5S39]|uniref:ArnR1-like winged helix-turn-helix domain-containing protein n=1 Tax=Halomonas kalidii TaxID=3043293 RepID=A0ABT6VQY3_9GAMM|nr:hypothetical protein [Halomonas kalidii]MDI5936395.1 hypothetical protein [Halomonas kalidii]MDI5985390.1 hypothetical protein [Halomonas kalidii]
MTPDTSATAGMQRSLRQCLSHMAALLYHHGHVLESVTVPHRGLDRNAMRDLHAASGDWSTCLRVLERSEAAAYNEQDRFVLTALGRELLFDMFGEGAADCA